jgi:hypothetical protein
MTYAALLEKELLPWHIDGIVSHVGSSYAWSLYFILRILSQRAYKPVVGEVLVQTQEWWIEDTYAANVLNSFIRERLEKKERIGFKVHAKSLSPRQLRLIERFLNTLDPAINDSLIDAFKQLKRSFVGNR